MTQSTFTEASPTSRSFRLTGVTGSTFRILRRSANRSKFVFATMLCVHIAGGLIFSVIEGLSILDGQYWASTTGATVGYGDISPHTALGKMFAMPYMWTMALLWAIVTAHIIGAILEDKNLFSHREQERNEAFYLVIAKFLGILPKHFTKLPAVEYWVQKHGFEVSDD